MALGLALSASAAEEDPSPTLRTQLLIFADEHQFLVKYLERVEGDPPQSISRNTPQQLDTLLEGYDYVVIRGTTGAIKEVLILSRSASAPPPKSVAPRREQSTQAEQTSKGRAKATQHTRSEYKVALDWQGDMHLVDALFLGRSGMPQRARLVVDLKGSAVVLPDNMMDTLGFRPEDLEAGTIQTSYGELAAKLGKLKTVRIGEVGVGSRNVEVAFVDDAQLGEHGLIGMKVFRGFNVSLDELNDELVLKME